MTTLERIGRFTLRSAADAGALTLQLWRALLSLPRILPVVGNRALARRRRADDGHRAQALPMAGLMSLCLGYVLALQCAAELRRFDAVRFVVDLVAVTFTRELGALITAVAVSGRSASAISAEVGTMMVTEEIDALRVMGLDPVEFTLAPKYLGALITVPCLTVLSTFCGVFAGYLFLAFSVDMNIRVFPRGGGVDSAARRLAHADQERHLRHHHRAGRLPGGLRARGGWRRWAGRRRRRW